MKNGRKIMLHTAVRHASSGVSRVWPGRSKTLACLGSLLAALVRGFFSLGGAEPLVAGSLRLGTAAVVKECDRLGTSVFPQTCCWGLFSLSKRHVIVAV